MKQDLFKYLPPEIITDILSRLPVRTIASSKRVSKPWLDLLETDYFVNSHLSKSVPSSAVMCSGLSLGCCIQVLEFEVELESHGFRRNPLTQFIFPERAAIVGAANGLLLLIKIGSPKEIIYICNPITRHYVGISSPIEEFEFLRRKAQHVGAYGFGSSRISGQHKVVRFIHNSECYVYTLGAGSWRRIARPSLALNEYDSIFGAFVDGHLYWTVTESYPLITCFDLETECFSSFPAPASIGGLSVSKDCLYFCEWKGDESVVVWLMKEYKSWSKEYVISHDHNYCDGYGNNVVYPLKVFKTRDKLMVWYDEVLIFYSDRYKTIGEFGSFDDPEDEYVCISSMPLTPSFLSLKGLGMENIISF